MDDPESPIDKSMLEANTDSLEPNLDPEPEPELEQGQEPDPEPEEEPGAKEDMLGACSSNNDCPPTDPVCSEFGFCQCECYKPGDMECWGKGESVCGERVDQPDEEETNPKENEGTNELDDIISTEEAKGNEVETNQEIDEEMTEIEGGIKETDGNEVDEEVEGKVDEEKVDKTIYEEPNDKPDVREPNAEEEGLEEEIVEDVLPERAADISGEEETGKEKAAEGILEEEEESDTDKNIQLGSCESDADCPLTDPVCSEFGFCQCEGYMPGDQECWGRGGNSAEDGVEGGNREEACTLGAACTPNALGDGGGNKDEGSCISDDDCPATDPVCSEFGFCQCECYKPGDMECWGKGETVCGGGVDQPEVEETNEKEQDNEVVEDEMAQDSEDKELKETDDNDPESDEAVEEVQEEEGEETAVSEEGGAVLEEAPGNEAEEGVAEAELAQAEVTDGTKSQEEEEKYDEPDEYMQTEEVTEKEEEEDITEGEGAEVEEAEMDEAKKGIEEEELTEDEATMGNESKEDVAKNKEPKADKAGEEVTEDEEGGKEVAEEGNIDEEEAEGNEAEKEVAEKEDVEKKSFEVEEENEVEENVTEEEVAKAKLAEEDVSNVEMDDELELKDDVVDKKEEALAEEENIINGSGSGEIDAVIGDDQDLGACGSNAECPPTDPVCSEYGFCQCESYKPGDPECWGNRDTKGGGGYGAGETDAVQGNDHDQGACASDADCPPTDPVCSEYGF